jgi:hypothetical protein
MKMMGFRDADLMYNILIYEKVTSKNFDIIKINPLFLAWVNIFRKKIQRIFVHGQGTFPLPISCSKQVIIATKI